MTRSRSGFGGRSRAIEGDSVRNRRADQKFPLGSGLEWVNGKLSLRTTGALTTQNGALELEVQAPLAQSSPLRLETDDSLTTSSGKLTASTVEIGAGLTRDARGQIAVSQPIAQFRASGSYDLNGTDVQVVWNHTDISDTNFILDSAEELVTVAADGLYRIDVSIAVTGSPSRSNVGAQVQINGTTQPPTAAGNYIRNANGHNESATSLALCVQLSRGDTIGVVTNRFANAGTVTLWDERTTLIVERKG